MSATESAGTGDRITCTLDRSKDKCHVMPDCGEEIENVRWRKGRKERCRIICFERDKKSSSERLKRPNDA